MEILLQKFKKVQGQCSGESASVTGSVVTGSKTRRHPRDVVKSALSQDRSEWHLVFGRVFLALQFVVSSILGARNLKNAHGDFAHTLPISATKRRNSKENKYAHTLFTQCRRKQTGTTSIAETTSSFYPSK